MRTAIISDLHLGDALGEDLLRDAGIRRTLFDELSTADRLVLLGDVLELRVLPLAMVLESARPFFEELGDTMAGKPVILLPGNHDHRLAQPLLEQLALDGKLLDLEQRAEPIGRAATQIAAWLDTAELQFAYPGVWLRDDVYATHGHYMDCHMSLPRVECIAAAMVMRAFGPLPDSATPEDYERVLSPVYGLAGGLVQAGLARSDVIRKSRPSELAWQTMSGRNHVNSRARRVATRAVVKAGVPLSIWTLNRLLRSDFDPRFSTAAISRSGIVAATELAEQMEIRAGHLITGHTHRGGPEDADGEWALRGGGHLHNTGSWVFASAFHHPGTPPGPYWPGTITWLEDEGPPRRSHLLIERGRQELGALAAQLASAGAP